MRKLPSFLQPYFASYDLEKLDIKKDKGLIINAILNKGDYKALEFLADTYTKEEVKSVIESPSRGMWYKWILSYWVKIFNLRIPRKQYQKALISF